MQGSNGSKGATLDLATLNSPAQMTRQLVLLQLAQFGAAFGTVQSRAPMYDSGAIAR